MRLLILGASGHGRTIADTVASHCDHCIVGFVDASYPQSQKSLPHPLLGSDADIVQIVREHSVDGIVIAVGDNWTRASIHGRLMTVIPNMLFPSIVDASAVVSRKASIADGSVIMPGAILNQGVTVGQHSIVNTGACVDHDCAIGAFASLAPRVACGGNVSIGDFTAIGIGATIIHGISIGEHSVLGAGAVAIESIPPHAVAVGLPARVVRHRSVGERYL